MSAGTSDLPRGGPLPGARPPGRRARVRAWKLFLPLGASILGLCTLKLLDPHLVSRTQLLAWLRPLGPWTPVAYLALLTVRPVTLLPGQLLTAIGGLLFGGLKGTLLAVLGSALASSVTFFIGRRWGTRFVHRALGDRAPALARAARENDFLFALVFTLSPLIPTDPILAVAASAGGSYRRTLAGTLLGILPGTLATAYFGSALAAGHAWVIALSVAGWAASVGGGIWVGVRVYRSLLRPTDFAERDAAPPLRARRLAAPPGR
jgi:uncharacterized membrane protein YdjX (TVP38/TMEM64 family)